MTKVEILWKFTTTDHMSSFACDMSAITPAERQQHIATIRTVFGAVDEIRELADGYAFRLAIKKQLFMQVAAFVSKERLCCPFFGFQIEIEPEGELMWLSLTGREGVKPFILEEIGEALLDEIAQAWQLP